MLLSDDDESNTILDKLHNEGEHSIFGEDGHLDGIRNGCLDIRGDFHCVISGASRVLNVPLIPILGIGGLYNQFHSESVLKKFLGCH